MRVDERDLGLAHVAVDDLHAPAHDGGGEAVALERVQVEREAAEQDGSEVVGLPVVLREDLVAGKPLSEDGQGRRDDLLEEHDLRMEEQGSN